MYGAAMLVLIVALPIVDIEKCQRVTVVRIRVVSMTHVVEVRTFPIRNTSQDQRRIRKSDLCIPEPLVISHSLWAVAP